jgi:hypothetical protein
MTVPDLAFADRQHPAPPAICQPVGVRTVSGQVCPITVIIAAPPLPAGSR